MSVGRWCTVLGVLISIGTAYLVMQFASIMDYVQALFSFFIAPLFGTVILGMLWKRATGRRLLGLAGGHAVLDRHVGVGEGRSVRAALRGAVAGCARHGGEHVPRAVVVDHLRAGHRDRQLVTKPEPDRELEGLVYGATAIPRRARAVVSEADLLGRSWSLSCSWF